MNGRLEKRSDGWWIVEYLSDPDMGPYDTRGEAEEDLRGLRRSEPFLKEIMELEGWALRDALRRHELS
jgi:hypothetical protein